MTEPSLPNYSPDIRGRSILITGASRGIGKALAMALASQGARVCLTARNESHLTEVVSSITDKGGEAVMVPGDVCSPTDVERVVEAAVGLFDGLDVLINNAGIAHYGSIVETPVDTWDDVMNTNVRSTFLYTKAAIRYMSVAGGGKIINIASTFGGRPVKGYSAYGASKAAVMYLTQVAALEGAKHGIQVNSVCPGYVRTDMNTEALHDSETLNRILARIPAGRIAQPDELVPVLLFLSSPHSDYVTGQAIVIDGGYGIM